MSDPEEAMREAMEAVKGPRDYSLGHDGRRVTPPAGPPDEKGKKGGTGSPDAKDLATYLGVGD